MPASVRKEDKAKEIAYRILGPPPCGLTDRFGDKKKYRKKDTRVQKEKNVQQGEDRFESVGYQY